MARWTKKLIKQQMSWTDECFKEALIDVYGRRMSVAEKEQSCEDIKQTILSWNDEVDNIGIPIRSPEINAMYRKHLCELDSEKLSLILEAFQKNKQYRSQVTIDAIMTELFERSTNPETRGKHGK